MARDAVHTPLESMSSFTSVVRTYTHLSSRWSKRGGRCSAPRGLVVMGDRRSSGSKGPSPCLGAVRGPPGPWATASAVSGWFLPLGSVASVLCVDGGTRCPFNERGNGGGGSQAASTVHRRRLVVKVSCQARAGRGPESAPRCRRCRSGAAGPPSCTPGQCCMSGAGERAQRAGWRAHLPLHPPHRTTGRPSGPGPNLRPDRAQFSSVAHV